MRRIDHVFFREWYLVAWVIADAREMSQGAMLIANGHTRVCGGEKKKPI